MKRELSKMRMQGLLKHYNDLKMKAKNLMFAGNFSDYADTLSQINKVKYQLVLCARNDF
jgi:hypothetical protein